MDLPLPVARAHYDTNYPKVLGHGYGPPHNWMGMEVPGCRGLGTAENPDNHYCFLPLDVDTPMEIHGKVQDPVIEDVNFHVTSNHSQALNVCGLTWGETQIAEDGTFVVTLDRNPANGRPNHLQLTPDSKRLFIRDSRKDWNQRPNAYRIERLDPPTAPRRSVEELTRVAARFIVDDVPMNFFFKQMIEFLPDNSLSEVSHSSQYGGMQTQKLLRGKLDLADDEAYVLAMDHGGSDYWVLTLYDWWAMSGNFWSRTSCLNDTQTMPNDDGTHTLVFSLQDPGVHNWVDTEGLNHTMFLQRWQLLPNTPGGPGGQLSQKSEVVKLADLKQVLPEETRWVTPGERGQQLADRLAAFNRRHEV